jgi:hypothetical protein
MKAKYYGLGRPFTGKDFDQMLWEYDVNRPVSSPSCLDTIIKPTNRCFFGIAALFLPHWLT